MAKADVGHQQPNRLLEGTQSQIIQTGVTQYPSWCPVFFLLIRTPSKSSNRAVQCRVVDQTVCKVRCQRASHMIQATARLNGKNIRVRTDWSCADTKEEKNGELSMKRLCWRSVFRHDM